MNSTKQAKIRRFYSLLDKTGLKESKDDLLENYNATSVTVLSDTDLDELINYLNKRLEFGNLKDYQWAIFNKENQQHMYLLSLCIQFGWTSWNEARQRNVADLGRLGNWIKKYSAVKKPLIAQTKEDLQSTLYQFEQMVVKQY